MFALIFNTPMRPSAKHNLAAIVTVLLCAALFGSLSAAYADEPAAPKTLTWEDLVPKASADMLAKAVALRDRFMALNASDQDLYRRVEIALELERELESGRRKAGELDPDEWKIVQDNLSISHPDILQFWKEVEVVRAADRVQNGTVREDLNGTQVRIPGYMLPLDLDGQAVREFLLVPYVGACIHTPPPPINQIVFVKSAEGVTSTGLFEPVWVTGRLSTERGSHALFLADGRGDVDAGYALDASAVHPYEN
ncbi:MAG: hypothetical protein ACI8PT_000979 [Gammaproteobacteria bacterium]|jgi:hypothetical protein